RRRGAPRRADRGVHGAVREPVHRRRAWVRRRRHRSARHAAGPGPFPRYAAHEARAAAVAQARQRPPVGAMAPRLVAVDPDATPEEVAAIVAALAVLLPEGGAPGGGFADDDVSKWVHAARLRSRRAGMPRGPWRLSGRIARRGA